MLLIKDRIFFCQKKLNIFIFQFFEFTFKIVCDNFSNFLYTKWGTLEDYVYIYYIYNCEYIIYNKNFDRS